MTTATSRLSARWGTLVVLLGVVWLTVPGNVPLYDGVGFPDEPYRFVPARDAATPAATTATVTLRMVDGINPGGLVANSAERGPQISVFAPPQAFQGPTSATEMVLVGQPIPLVPPAPSGERVSNVYALTFTADGLPAALRPQAAAPAITLRASSVPTPSPVMYHRANATSEWKLLATRQVGQDNFSAMGPGAGEYVLAQGPRPPAQKSSGQTTLLLVIAAAVVVVMGALLLVRRAGSRAGADGVA